MIEILSPSHLVSVQDLGRFDHLHHGVGISGAMDKPALCAGNLMLANPPTAAGIEIPFFPLRLRFHRACTFALTGADAGATLDDTPMLPWWCARAYLTVTGGIQVAPMRARGASVFNRRRPRCR